MAIPDLGLTRILFECNEVEAILLWGSCANGESTSGSDYDIVCLRSSSASSLDVIASRLSNTLSAPIEMPTSDIPGITYKGLFYGTKVDLRCYEYNTVLSYALSSKSDCRIDNVLHTLFYSMSRSVIIMDRDGKGSLLINCLKRPLEFAVSSTLIRDGLQFPLLSELLRIEVRSEKLAAAHFVSRVLILVGKIFAGINSTYCYTRVKGLNQYFKDLRLPPPILNKILSICEGGDYSSILVSRLLIDVLKVTEEKLIEDGALLMIKQAKQHWTM